MSLITIAFFLKFVFSNFANKVDGFFERCIRV